MRILFIGIHPDDVELGCGATVALCADLGHEVSIVDLTRGESSSNGTPEQRAGEAQSAARVLGCARRSNLALPDTGIRSEDEHQQRAVSNFIRECRPDVLVFPNGDDPHPDHASGAALVLRAAYLAGIHGYPGSSSAWKVQTLLECSGRREVQADVIVDTSATFARKRDAILAHASQFARDADSTATTLNDPDFLSAMEARDRSLGQRIGVRYGEAFHTLSPIALAGFDIFVRERRE